MSSRKNRNLTNRRGKGRRQYNSTLNAVRAGGLNRPPDNSGTVQIPRPLTAKQQVMVRTFKADYLLATSAANPVFFATSLYAPFFYVPNNAASSYTYSPPASLTSTFASFGLYKVKRIQLIFEPLLTSAIVPSPYTIGMVVDVQAPTFATFPQSSLLEYENVTKVSPSYPTEVKYNVPKLAAEKANDLVLQGGWIDTDVGSLPSAYGQIVVIQSTPISVSTTYTNLTVVYEMLFKNPA